MSYLGADSDRVVRSTVADYFEGRFQPALDGEIYFETRNSRYRLMDGVLFAATDSSMIGAELVGWLSENGLGAKMQPAWSEGCRAVLVDRNRAQHIIITSIARQVLDAETLGSPTARGGSAKPQRSRIEASVASARPGPTRTDAPPPSPRIPALPPSPPIIRPSTPPNANSVSVRSPLVHPQPLIHPPPRPIRKGAAAPTSARLPARPLPYPAPPPPRPRSPFSQPMPIPVASQRPPPLPSIEATSRDTDVETERDPTEHHDRTDLPFSRSFVRESADVPESKRATFAPTTMPTASNEAIPLVAASTYPMK